VPLRHQPLASKYRLLPSFLRNPQLQLSFLLSFRNEVEKSAAAAVFLLSFRNEVEESAVALVLAVALLSQHQYRHRSKRNA
jgi:hypothetical protein